MCDPDDKPNDLDEVDEEYLADVETQFGWYEVQEMMARGKGWVEDE